MTRSDLRPAILKLGIVALGLGLSAAPGARAADLEPRALALAYEVYAGGLHALSLEARLARSAGRYQAQLEARTDGFIARLFDFWLTSEVSGAGVAEKLSPDRFKTAARWQKRDPRSVEIIYGPGEGKTVRAEPPPEEDEREAVPEWLQRDTLDPLSASVAVMERLREAGSCDAEIPIFDGRRRFDLTAVDKGEVEIAANDYSSYAGPARKCELELVQVTGFWEGGRRDADRLPTRVTVYLAPALPGGPPVPVRIEGERQVFGGFRVHLIEARSLAAPAP